MTGSGSIISDLVKEMVKEMDANDFYARGDIYDESLEEPWFNIDVQLAQQDEGNTAAPRASLRKPWSEFQRLHYLLLTDEFGCNASVKDQLPTLPTIQELSVRSGDRAGNRAGGDGNGSGGNGDAKAGGPKSSNEVAEKLDAYLNTLLSIPAVVRSQVFGGFLDDGNRRGPGTENDVENDTARGPTSESDGSKGGAEAKGDADGAGGEEFPREPETAIDFLVQPFDYTSAYVPRRASHTERIDVLRGESVVWKFEVLDHLDIDFSVVFRPHPVAVFVHPGESNGLPPEETLSVQRSEEVGQEDDHGVLPDGGATDAAGAKDNAGGTESRGKGKNGSPSDKGKMPRAEGGSGWWTGGSSAGMKEQTDEDARMLSGKAGAAAGAAVAAGGDGHGQESTVHLPTRYSTSGGDPVQGSFTCASDGTCILKWDNSYSRLRGKRLRFVMESVTVRTMLAAIEAAGAADHKRRAIRSVAAQTILDSSPDQVHITVTAVSITDGAGGAVDGYAESTNDGCSGNSSESRSDGGSAGIYRFGRIRRVAATLLRDLGTLVDAQDMGASPAGRPVAIANKDDGRNGDEGGRDDEDSPSDRSGAHGVKPRAEACGADYSKADATGVGKLVERFEQLEDEVASCSARRAQSEAQAKVLLATLQKSNTKTERLERELEKVREQLAALQGRLESTETSRDEAVAAEAASSARRQSLEEELLRTKRERDLLQAERSVWQVARSGIQEELAKVVADLEQERHRHEDASRALSKSRESRVLAEAEVARLTRRLEEERGGIGGIRAALAAEREASRLAREEAEDARAAVADLDAAVAELGAQKRVLVAGLRARERALGDRCSAAEARAEESAMMRRAADTRVKELEEEAERRESAQADAEVRLQRLRAEKKVLLAEIRRGAVGGGAGAARASTVAAAASGAGDSLGMTGFVGRYAGEGGAVDAGGVKGIRGDCEDEEGAASTEGSTMAGSTMVPGGSEVVMAGKVTPMPPISSEAVQDNKAMLKQLSRQLVHLRERQHHLREDLAIDPGDQSARRLQGDLERAVQNLEMRIRKLLAGVVKDGSPPPPSSSTGHAAAADSRGDDGRGSPEDLERGGERTPLPPSPPKEDVESFAV